ncbi:MAG: hypothetical protein RL007_2585 [Bacteroidota bacterium]|jgi:hypothetical protein
MDSFNCDVSGYRSYFVKEGDEVGGVRVERLNQQTVSLSIGKQIKDYAK